MFTKEETAKLSRLFSEISAVFENAASRNEDRPIDEPDANLVAALTALPAKYQRVVALVSQGIPGSLVASNGELEGEGRWLPILEATEGVASVMRGGKRVITTIANSNPALSGITYSDKEEEAFVPDNVASVARFLWPHISDEKPEEIFGDLMEE